MGKRQRESEPPRYCVHAWNWMGNDTEGGSVHEDTTEECTEEEEGDFKVGRPSEAFEEGFYENLAELAGTILGTMQMTLNHEKTGTSIHRYKYTWNVTYLEQIGAKSKVCRTTALEQLVQPWRFVRKGEMKCCFTLPSNAEQQLAEIMRSQYGPTSSKNADKTPAEMVAMFDCVAIRVRNGKTGIESVMSFNNLVRTLVADPPIDFFYSIGFCGTPCVFEKMVEKEQK